MKMKILICTITLVVLNFYFARSQSAKRFFADAKASELSNNIDEAIDFYKKATTIDPKYYEAFIELGKCEEIKKRFESAIENYKSASQVRPNEIEPLERIGAIFKTLQKYNDAIIYYNNVTSIKKKNIKAYLEIAFCFNHIKEFNKSINECNKAIEIDRTIPLAYLYKAMAFDSLLNAKEAFDNYSLAINALEKSDEFKNSISKVDYYNYYFGMGNSQVKNNLIDLGIDSYSKAIELNKKAFDAYEMRGKAYSLKMKMKDAENDYNQSIVINAKNSNAFAGRGYVYHRIGEYEKSISDNDIAIMLNKNNASAYKGKGQSLEAITKIEEAKICFEDALKFAKQNKETDLLSYENLLKNISEKLYQAKREVNTPSVVLKNADNDKLKITTDKSKLKITIEGKVNDESKIEKVLIGDVDVQFNKQELNPSFSLEVNIFMKDEIEVMVQDIYGNVLKTFYKIIRAEQNLPKLALTYPIAINGNAIELPDSVGYKINISGKIEDESLIKTVIVNGKTANFDSKTLNPTFSLNLDIVGTDSIKMKIVDEYDNSITTVYLLKRSGVKNSEISPMGKTWVVFIDNSKYTQLPLLEASSNDVLSMKSALQSYNIQNVIIKNDLSKAQMEKFFSIELRDLINNNNVNSIMIFYAGHGKFINENGYWLPIDANKKDEFTFFNVSNLKNYLGTYKPLVHSLVVSDACETGPAFYLAMRDVNKIPECGQWEASKKKSAQVLTSTTIDLNDDKSVFTKSFVAALKSCNDKCISIEKIADKISKQSMQYQKPKPKLGIIPALNSDDEATFFFVKK
jgi:tetratricopeptide (TPR) repeat protein